MVRNDELIHIADLKRTLDTTLLSSEKGSRFATCKPFGEQDRRARTYSKISDYKKGRLYPLLGRKWAITGMSTAQAE